jgi:outer membrane protein assembly factor BamB
VRRALLVVFAALAGCGGFVDNTAPWERDKEHDVGRPVLAHRWKKVVADHASSNRPQEMAGAAVSSVGGDAEIRAGRGTVFIGAHDGMFHALSTRDGSTRWSKLLGPTSGVPLVLGELVYVGGDDGVLHALAASDGAEKWKYAAKGAILRPPVASGDLILFTTDGDRVIALDRGSGKWRWQYEREQPEEFTVRGNAGVTVDGEQVLTGFSDGHLVSVSRATGDVLWVRSLAGDAKQFVDVDTTPVVDGGVVYGASVQGGLYALAAKDGSERWQAKIAGVSQIVKDRDRLYVVGADSGLHAVDLGGNVLWRQGFARAGDPSRPVVDGHYLFLSVSEQGLYIIDKRDGQLVQSFLPGPGITAAPAVTGDSLFVMSNGGILYAMSVRRFW